MRALDAVILVLHFRNDAHFYFLLMEVSAHMLLRLQLSVD